MYNSAFEMQPFSSLLNVMMRITVFCSSNFRRVKIINSIMLLIRQIRVVLFHCQIVDILVKLLSPRQEDDEKQEMAADLRETIERHDEQ